MRNVIIEINIPNGQNCRRCKARQKVNHKDICLLYGVELKYHLRRISNTRDYRGHNETAEVFEKCDACLQNSDEYAITRQIGEQK
ncbi:hypothetical protein LI171_04910 [Emergencia timonensis]|uniref:hypothetical protein n=1 Tax=Emergencia timonensis TaxID=1776384 RepID=UPI001D05DCF8|nr:hypothetical protein [Emergencia timonensis]MCB6475578.1 hypothetical protein [Emergencia timonensis]